MLRPGIHERETSESFISLSEAAKLLRIFLNSRFSGFQESECSNDESMTMLLLG